ncbi:MAG: hypothetical protein QOH23_253, partial [Gaiellaceae bacterium]|nr:hypothetical protein [Gaiellaceae bacterium]
RIVTAPITIGDNTERPTSGRYTRFNYPKGDELTHTRSGDIPEHWRSR